MGTDSPPTTGATYAGSYSRGVQHGERTQVTCRVRSEQGGTSELVLASGSRALLDWDTTADKANVAAAVLRHWLGRVPDVPELHVFLDEIASDWIAGQPWELTGDQLTAAGLEP